MAFRLTVQNYEKIKALLIDQYYGMNTKSTIADGSDLVSLIRRYERDCGTDTPLFILGFSGDESVKMKMLGSGCDTFMTKPIDKTKLLNVLQLSIS